MRYESDDTRRINAAFKGNCGLSFRKNEEAKTAGIDQHGHFYTSVAFTLGSLIGFDFKPEGYGPMIATMIESLTDGLQAGVQGKGVNGTFIKIVRD